MPNALPAALAAHGIGVLNLDLGYTPAPATTTSEDADLAALRLAADALAASTPSRRC